MLSIAFSYGSISCPTIRHSIILVSLSDAFRIGYVFLVHSDVVLLDCVVAVFLCLNGNLAEGHPASFIPGALLHLDVLYTRPHMER